MQGMIKLSFDLSIPADVYQTMQKKLDLDTWGLFSVENVLAQTIELAVNAGSSDPSITVDVAAPKVFSSVDEAVLGVIQRVVKEEVKEASARAERYTFEEFEVQP